MCEVAASGSGGRGLKTELVKRGWGVTLPASGGRPGLLTHERRGHRGQRFPFGT